MSSFSKIAASALLFLTSVQGHMIMNSPKPFGTPNNSPLGPGDFPCKASTTYDRTSVSNVMAIGESQTLAFTGSAVHGGGSCQVSLTTDLQPTAGSKWMVIKSIEGGCPSNVAGNLPADAEGHGASTFQYTIPEGIAPGEYTIAWTWLNKIGNREFYMNCGPATVTAAKKKRYAPAGVSLVRKQTSFPDMYVANVADVNACQTVEGSDYNYPSPGDDVQKAGTGPYLDLTCGASGSSPAQSPAAGASSPAGSSAPVATQSAAATVSSAPTVPAGSAPSQTLGGVFASGAASAPVATASTPVASAPAASAPAASAPAASAPAASAAPAPAASSGTSSAGQQTPGAACSNEGEWICLGTSYQRCASGVYSQVMSLSTGMKCTPGTSSSINMYPGKRSVGGWLRRADSFKA